MRVILSTFVLLALVAIFIADGVSMYGAHRAAVNFSAEAADQAAQTYVATRGNEDSVSGAIQDLATTDGVKLLSLTYHMGTTRWYEVKVEVKSSSILLKHIPFFKNRLAQQSTAVLHF